MSTREQWKARSEETLAAARAAIVEAEKTSDLEAIVAARLLSRLAEVYAQVAPADRLVVGVTIDSELAGRLVAYLEYDIEERLREGRPLTVHTRPWVVAS